MWISWGALASMMAFASGCASSREHCSCHESDAGPEPDGGDCVDTDTSDADGGVPGWRMTWAAQAGGGGSAAFFGYDIAWDLAPLPDSSVLVSGRYEYEGLFGAGEPNETTLPHFGIEDVESTNCFVALYGRGGDLQWAQGYGGSGWDAGAFGVALAGEDDLWSIGAYDLEMTIGLGQPNETSLTGDYFEESGSYDNVLARYSVDGQLAWAISSIDAARIAFFRGIAPLPDGSVVTAGYFSIGIALAPGTPEETILTTPDSGDEDVAIARFAADGTLLWARQISGPGVEFVWSVVRLLGGELLVAGTYQETVVLGAGEAHETALTCGAGEPPDAGPDGDGERCPFLAAYDEDGALQWARDLGYPCPVQDVFPTVEAAPDGGFAIAGGFVGTAILGEGEPNETAIGPTPEDRFDVFVARYTADGSLLWARQSVGGLDDPTTMDSYLGYPMTFLDSGELVITGGYVNGAPVLGQGEPHETMLPDANSYRIFLAMLYPNGNLAWAIDQGGPAPDVAATVAAYGDSTFFVGGSFAGETTFGTSSADQKTMTANGDSEIFVLRFDRTEE
jgi:hypothetical protein